MSLFDRMYLPERPVPDGSGRGPFRFLRVFWDNMGKLLAANALCFAGFLPLELLISLGLVYENFWLAFAGGILGGAVAGPVWTATLGLCLFCFRGRPQRWFAFWRRTLRDGLKPATVIGMIVGGVFSALLLTARFFLGLMAEGMLPAAPVWAFLAVDFLLLSVPAALLFPPFCVKADFMSRMRGTAALLWRGKSLLAAVLLLIWCALGVALFPVSVPFAVVFGFWPIALIQAQLLGPGLDEQLGLDEAFAGVEAETEDKGSGGERAGLWFRRWWPLALGVLAALSLALGFVRVAVNRRVPDLQIAVVHAQALPDDVLKALEESLAALAGDANGDGEALARVNDYVVRFDGLSGGADLQAAGITRLVSDLRDGDSAIWVVEDADGFLRWYGDQVDGGGAARWGELPALAALDAGMYASVLDIDADHSGQELLERYTVFPASGCGAEWRALFFGGAGTE